MSDRPILFSAPMVRALLAGTKTQTRRVVKPQPYAVTLVGSGNHLFDYRSDLNDYSRVLDMKKAVTLCPYGQPGDRLWVRESLRPWSKNPELMAYAADDSNVGAWHDMNYPTRCGSKVTRAVPSIHLPRAWSRITLEITGVRVERLQDISEADAQAEGCALECMTPTGDDSGSAIHGPGGYRALWESINGPCSWDANPWVWVVEFKRLEGAA